LKVEATHSVINRECRNFAVHQADIEEFRAQFRPKSHFVKLREFVAVKTPKRMGTFKEGNLALAPIPRGTDTNVQNALAQSLPISKPPTGGSVSLGRCTPRVSVMAVVRERHRLLTAMEKKIRTEVAQGKKDQAEAVALKARIDAGKTRVQLEKEALKLKLYEEDLVLAAT
jgi:hypothetical protein